MKQSDNLRGLEATVVFDGKVCRVTVITHIRAGVWMVEGRQLPQQFERWRGCRRTTVHRDDLTLVTPEGTP